MIIKIKSRKLSIIDGRHPVVEQILVDKVFVPNDIELGSQTDLIILSGPNASGKSCYLRQVGLLQIMAQIGSWIPAKSCTLGIADQLFTRVGAVDDLAAGQSTFMVEMIETAFILNKATEKSLVLLDEIGRGTSTFDGLSIAWSVSEFLAKKIESRSIFATHYHELNQISEYIENVENYQVLVQHKNNSLSFLHKVKKGGTNKSYGIEAARLAGVPKEVINNAKRNLNNLREKSSNNIQVIQPIKNCNKIKSFFFTIQFSAALNKAFVAAAAKDAPPLEPSKTIYGHSLFNNRLLLSDTPINPTGIPTIKLGFP